MQFDSILPKALFKSVRNGLFYSLSLLICFLTIDGSFAQSLEITPDMIQKGQEALDGGLITPEQAGELQHKATLILVSMVCTCFVPHDEKLDFVSAQLTCGGY